MRGLDWEWHMRRQDDLRRAICDMVALGLFLAFSLSGFALVQVAGLG